MSTFTLYSSPEMVADFLLQDGRDNVLTRVRSPEMSPLNDPAWRWALAAEICGSEWQIRRLRRQISLLPHGTGSCWDAHGIAVGQAINHRMFLAWCSRFSAVITRVIVEAVREERRQSQLRAEGLLHCASAPRKIDLPRLGDGSARRLAQLREVVKLHGERICADIGRELNSTVSVLGDVFLFNGEELPESVEPWTPPPTQQGVQLTRRRIRLEAEAATSSDDDNIGNV